MGDAPSSGTVYSAASSRGGLLAISETRRPSGCHVQPNNHVTSVGESLQHVAGAAGRQARPQTAHTRATNRPVPTQTESGSRRATTSGRHRTRSGDVRVHRARARRTARRRRVPSGRRCSRRRATSQAVYPAPGDFVICTASATRRRLNPDVEVPGAVGGIRDEPPVWRERRIGLQVPIRTSDA